MLCPDLRDWFFCSLYQVKFGFPSPPDLQWNVAFCPVSLSCTSGVTVIFFVDPSSISIRRKRNVYFGISAQLGGMRGLCSDNFLFLEAIKCSIGRKPEISASPLPGDTVTWHCGGEWRPPWIQHINISRLVQILRPKPEIQRSECWINLAGWTSCVQAILNTGFKQRESPCRVQNDSYSN